MKQKGVKGVQVLWSSPRQPDFQRSAGCPVRCHWNRIVSPQKSKLSKVSTPEIPFAIPTCSEQRPGACFLLSKIQSRCVSHNCGSEKSTSFFLACLISIKFHTDLAPGLYSSLLSWFWPNFFPEFDPSSMACYNSVKESVGILGRHLKYNLGSYKELSGQKS